VQEKSSIDTPGASTTIGAVWDAASAFETISTSAHCVEEDVVNPMTMADPCARPPPVTVRSGEIAPFHTNRPGSVTTPCCTMPGPPAPPGRISNHRSSDPPPPNTAIAVQTTWAPTWGSIAETACSSRPSSVSRSNPEPGHCTAGAGVVKRCTGRVRTGESSGSPVVGSFRTEIKLYSKPPRGSAVSDWARIQPVPDGSACWAGTGVNNRLPSGFWIPVNRPVRYLGSYNFSSPADIQNGENLLLIRDRRIAVSYTVEALRIFDHYHFRVIQHDATKAKRELVLAKPPRKPGELPWWDEDYTDARKIRDRELFA